MPRIPKPATCGGCPGENWLHPVPPLNKQLVRGGFSRGEGRGLNGVTCIGEALGQNEDADGLPFRPHAQAGSLLERAFKRLGYSREQFRINNVVRCFGGDTLVRAYGIRKIYRRPFSGDVIRVKTDFGSLTGTPNHPVLTQRGMVALQALAKNDYLTYDSLGECIRSLEPDVEYGPTTFDELYRTLSDRWGRERTTSRSVDFHGDGMDGDVDVVSKLGLLRYWPESSFSESFEELPLKPADDPSTVLFLESTCQGSSGFFFDRYLSSANRSMGSIRHSFPSEYSHELVSHSERLASVPDRNSGRLKRFSESELPDTGFLGNGFNPLTNDVTLAKVGNIERLSWSGHVYNLETSSGNYTADGFIVSNCRPPHDHLVDASYEDQVIQHCRQYLMEELTQFKPRCILALGGTAARELTGLAGAKQGVSYIRGYAIPSIVPSTLNVPVVSTFHPSFLRQGKPQYFGTLCHDIQRAVEIARTGLPPERPTRYQPRPTLDEANAFRIRVEQSPNLWLTYDIETPSSAEMSEDERDEDRHLDITQIQFSLAPGEGIVFPIAGAPLEYMEMARQILSGPHRKAGFYNHLFDDPRLRYNGVKFGGPPTHDLYEMWHHMQPDLPANLQFVSSFYGMDRVWKHLFGVNLGEYGCCDVDAPQRILERLPDQLRKRGLWDGYERLVYQLRPILDRMEDRGIPINDERRLKFGSELDKAADEIDAQMQQLVPDELKNVTPKQGYKKVPKDTTGLAHRKFVEDDVEVWRWCRMEPFKPSSQQLIRYMKFKGHLVPKKAKTDKDTSEARELERLSRKTHDPLYKKVIWYREVRLMKATFVDGWQPSSDGRVHTTFKFAPATGQLSSSDPNVQNAPEHEKEGGRAVNLADEFQKIIEAPPGHKIVSFDHKSFHALTLAWLAQDSDYERIVRMDVHSFVASAFLRLKSIDVMMGYQDDELRDYLKWVKREHRFVRDYKCKRVILGWGFGRGYRSIYEAYMESFENESETKRLVQTLEGCFPKTVKWRRSIMQKAHYDTYLVSPFGFIRWFWDVHHFGPNGEIRNGEQAEQAIAFLPANCAFGMMREQALQMSARELDERFGLINNVHDSWKYCCVDELVEECLHTVKGLMEAPCPTLKSPTSPDGLWCAVQASVGQNNAARSEANPDGKEEVEVPTVQVQKAGMDAGQARAADKPGASHSASGSAVVPALPQ